VPGAAAANGEPVGMELGSAAVRLSPEGEAEVVWGRRLDPARIEVLSIPLPSSGRRWGEVVLHDGVPHGERITSAGPSYPVFDEIELWAPSRIPVQSVTVRVGTDDDLAALVALGEAEDVVVEAWHTVTPLCAACSAGRVDQDNQHNHDESDGVVRGGRTTVGVAASPGATADLLARWVAQDPASRGAGTPEAVA